MSYLGIIPSELNTDTQRLYKMQIDYMRLLYIKYPGFLKIIKIDC